MAFLDVGDFYDPRNIEWPHYLENALKARALYRRDVEYVVTNEGEVIIVDEFTGRLQPGRRWSDGLHQAVEAKEGLKVREETQTLATITIQNFFRLYGKVAGMTGTAMTEAKEFKKIYRLGVVAVPSNRPMRRDSYADVIYGTEKEKYDGIVEEISGIHATGRPILVGTISIEKSERLSSLLSRRGIEHEILNAKQHEREAHIVSSAGELGSVVISTNMAGRGTDIVLGQVSTDELLEYWKDLDLAPDDLSGDLPRAEIERRLDEHWAGIFLSEEERAAVKEPGGLRAALEKHWDSEYPPRPHLELGSSVAELGGLHVVGTERHEARRIDNQLRGRAGRQGDPGSSRFFLSLDDELMRIFAADWVKNFLRRIGLKDGQRIDNRMVSRQLMKAQLRVEEHNFGIRRRLLEYDEVMNEQRTIIYEIRQQCLEKKNLTVRVRGMIEQSVTAAAAKLLFPEPPKPPSAQERASRLATWCSERFGLSLRPHQLLLLNLSDVPRDRIEEKVLSRMQEDKEKGKELGSAERAAIAEIVAVAFEPEKAGAPPPSDEEAAELISKRIREQFKAAVPQEAILAAREERLAELGPGYVDELPREEIEKLIRERALSVTAEIGGGGSLPADRLSALVADATRGAVDREIFTEDRSPAERLARLAAWVEDLFDIPLAPHEIAGLDGAEKLAALTEGELLLAGGGACEIRIGAALAEAYRKNQLRLTKERTERLIAEAVAAAGERFLFGEARETSWPERVREIVRWAKRKFDVDCPPAELLEIVGDGLARTDSTAIAEIEEVICREVFAACDRREKELGEETMRGIEQFVLLDVIDRKWKDHLREMDYLREGIWLRGWGLRGGEVKDVYKKEGYEIFQEMLAALYDEVTDLVLRIAPVREDMIDHLASRWEGGEEGRGEIGGFGDEKTRAAMEQASEHGGKTERVQPVRHTGPRVRPNAPCPCGSGRKYKHCCRRRSAGTPAE